jgi:hypothetical protein
MDESISDEPSLVRPWSVPGPFVGGGSRRSRSLKSNHNSGFTRWLLCLCLVSLSLGNNGFGAGFLGFFSIYRRRLDELRRLDV